MGVVVLVVSDTLAGQDYVCDYWAFMFTLVLPAPLQFFYLLVSLYIRGNANASPGGLRCLLCLSMLFLYETFSKQVTTSHYWQSITSYE